MSPAPWAGPFWLDPEQPQAGTPIAVFLRGMSLNGTLTTLPLQDILQLLGSSRRTGRLQVQKGPLYKRLSVEDGFIVAAESNDPCERLGAFLVSRGFISLDHLREGLEVQETLRGTLGSFLVRMGAIGNDLLDKALIHKTRESIYSVFDWTDAAFEFTFHPVVCEPEVRVKVNSHHALWAGHRRREKLARLREHLPNSSIVLDRTDRTPPEDLLSDTLTEKIYSLVNGRKTIAEIRLNAQCSEFTISEILYEWLQNDFMSVVGTAPNGAASASAPELTVEDGTRLLEAGHYEEAWYAFHGALEEEPARRDLRSLLELAEIRLLEAIYRNNIPPRAVPRRVLGSDQIEANGLGPEERYLLSRMNGAWDIRSIVATTPMREVDSALHLNHLLEGGHIELTELWH